MSGSGAFAFFFIMRSTWSSSLSYVFQQLLAGGQDHAPHPNKKQQGIEVSDPTPTPLRTPGPRTQEPGLRTQDPRPRLQDLGPRTKDSVPRPRTQDLGLRTQDSGPGPRTPGPGPRTKDPALPSHPPAPPPFPSPERTGPSVSIWILPPCPLLRWMRPLGQCALL